MDHPGTSIDLSGPRLRADLNGYVVNDQFIDGFKDDPALPATARRKVAEWAQAFATEGFSEEQRQLLAVPAPADDVGLEVLRGAVQNIDVDLPEAAESGLYDLLADEQRKLMREPWRKVKFQGRRRDYPLSAGELAQLVDVSVTQVRDWEKHGLLPAHRINGRRQFFSAAVIHAFAFAVQPRQRIAAIRELSEEKPDARFEALVRYALRN